MATRSAPPVTPDDVRAAVAAGAELGGDYDDALATALLDRLDAQARHRLHARGPSLAHDAVTVLIALGSIGLGVLFVAAADPLGPLGGTVATVVVWVAIAVVNVAHARARRG